MLTVAHGQRSNFPNFLPVSGLAASASRATSWPTFLRGEALYTEGLLFLLFTSSIFLHRRHFFFSLALAFSSQPPSASLVNAHQEGCTQREDDEEREQQCGHQVGSLVV
jgi:hypothetical protein